MRKITDEELRVYQKRLGAEQYRALYLYESNKVRRLMRNNIRQSGKDYVNSKEKLNAIKEKYKNGVTQEIMEEWLEK
jgi:hypothetical protein